MRFCPDLKCPHYSRATKYPRACYYEPQCWRGNLDIMLFVVGRLPQSLLTRIIARLRRKRSAPKKVESVPEQGK